MHICTALRIVSNLADSIDGAYCSSERLKQVSLRLVEAARLVVAEVRRLQVFEKMVKVLNDLREQEGEAVMIPNANPDYGGPAQVITVYSGFDDEDGKAFSSDQGKHGMNESLLNCLEKARLVLKGKA